MTVASSVYSCVIVCLAFRCAYCYHLNPARKKLPTAPKLMKTPSIDHLERRPPEQDKEQDVDSPQLVKRIPSQGQMHIPEKGGT